MLRSAKISDFPAILEINLEWEHFLAPLDSDRLRFLHKESIYHKVAEVDGNVVGFLLVFGPEADYQSENYEWFSSRYTDFLYIDRIAVRQEHRGLKLGRLFYEDLFTFGRKKGFLQIGCEYYSKPLNSGSAAFHSKLGFKEVGKQTVGEKEVSLQVVDL